MYICVCVCVCVCVCFNYRDLELFLLLYTYLCDVGKERWGKSKERKKEGKKERLWRGKIESRSKRTLKIKGRKLDRKKRILKNKHIKTNNDDVDERGEK